MQFPRVRFTIRWLVLAVAIAAMACGAEAMMRRRAGFLKRAEQETARERIARETMRDFERNARETDQQAESYRRAAEDYRRREASERGSPGFDASYAESFARFAASARESARRRRIRAARYAAQAEYRGRLRTKYEGAAAHPWRIPDRDPCEPIWSEQYPLSTGPTG